MSEEEHKRLIKALEEHFEENKKWSEIHHYQELAFIIDRFCGGKIEFPVEDIMSETDNLDIQRAYRDGRVTYITRRSLTEPV